MAGPLRCRYLLLEDLETRDVLMPLVFMKELFDKNYSRRLKNEKLRVVELDGSAGLEAYETGQLLWRPAFESSKGVKVAVCRALGETEIPQVSPVKLLRHHLTSLLQLFAGAPNTGCEWKGVRHTLCRALALVVAVQSGLHCTIHCTACHNMAHKHALKTSASAQAGDGFMLAHSAQFWAPGYWTTPVQETGPHTHPKS